MTATPPPSVAGSPRSPWVLAGDIGGTSTRIALVEVVAGPGGGQPGARPTIRVAEFEKFRSKEHGGLEEIVAAFLARHPASIASACFGISGPVRDGVVHPPNLPWVVVATSLAKCSGAPRVDLINDLVANAWGVLELAPTDFALLSAAGSGDQAAAGASAGPGAGTVAVIAAGTGLGEAGAVWDGRAHHGVPSEGGHADFAPRDELETQMLLHLRREFGAVSVERVLSGPGLVNIYGFLKASGRGVETPEVAAAMKAGDPAAAITHAARDGRCELCSATLDRFVSLYGAEAGNLALRFVATGGIYVGGGIAPRILPRIQSGAFMQAFLDKGRMRPLLETIPVRVILKDTAALLGAARYAANAATESSR